MGVEVWGLQGGWGRTDGRAAGGGGLAAGDPRGVADGELSFLHTHPEALHARHVGFNLRAAATERELLTRVNEGDDVVHLRTARSRL